MRLVIQSSDASAAFSGCSGFVWDWEFLLPSDEPSHLPFLGFRANLHIGTSALGFPSFPALSMMNFAAFPASNLTVNPSCFHLVEDTKAWWPSLGRRNTKVILGIVPEVLLGLPA